MARPRTKHKHLPKYVSPINGAYWYRGPKGVDGKKPKPIRLADVGDESKMYEEYGKLTKEVPAGPIHTMADLFDRYEKEIVPRLAPRTQTDYKWILKQLRKVFGPMRPHDVVPRDIGMFLDVEKGRQSRNRMVAVLSAVFQKAVGRWYIVDRNPCMGVERNEVPKRKRYVTNEEFKAVYDIAPPRVQIMMDLALLTGQRQGDLLALKWEQVLEDGIFIQQGKTGKKLLIAYSDELKEVLTRARRMEPQIPRYYVVRRRDGQRYTSQGFKAIWIRVMDRAMGKKFGTNRKPIEAVLKERYHFHDLRVKSGSDDSVFNDAYLRLGHISPSMTRGVYDRGVRKVTPLK